MIKGSKRTRSQKRLARSIKMKAAVSVIAAVSIYIAILLFALNQAVPNQPFNTGNSSIETYIYCVGDSGHGGENLTYYAPIMASSHAIGQWKETTPYPVGVDDVGCDIYGTHIYCVGTNSTIQANQTFYAPISSNGISQWSKSTSYPDPVTYDSCSAYRGYIYCVGDWFPPSNQTRYTKITSSGVGNWITTTSYPIPFYWAGCAINNGYIYCVGGAQLAHTIGESDAGVFADIAASHRNTSLTYYAPVSGNGIGQWKETTPYPQVFVMGGCSIYNNYIYCVAGEPGSNVYYAPVSNSGIGKWATTTSLPVDIYQGGCVIHDGYIYCIGDREPATTGNQSWYAPILENGGIGNWTKATPFPIPFYGDSYCEIPGSGGGWTSGGGPEN
jgi:hypothetical protein